jgi:hypothetical protein
MATAALVPPERMTVLRMVVIPRRDERIETKRKEAAENGEGEDFGHRHGVHPFSFLTPPMKLPLSS